MPVISYFFAPLGGVGTLRPLKFVKYLRDFGWEPVVLTCDPRGQHHAEDSSLLADIPEGVRIERVPCRTRHALWERLEEHRLPWLANFLRARVDFPDPWHGWVVPAARKAIELAEGADAVCSTSAPYSCHLIAKRVKDVTGLPWLADFRDEWSRNPATAQLPRRLRRRTKLLESDVLRAADIVVSVNDTLTAQFMELGGGPPEKFVTISNGFDMADFEEPVERQPDRRFRLAYAGSAYAGQEPDCFVQALCELSAEHVLDSSNFVLQLAGRQQPGVFRGLEPLVKSHGFLPHRDAVRLCRAADALLLFVSPERGPAATTGKLFEYLASGRPILAVVPEDGEAARIVRETSAGTVVGADDVAGCKKALVELLERHQRGELPAGAAPDKIAPYSRRHLTRMLADELEAMTGGARTLPRRAAAVPAITAERRSERDNVAYYASHAAALRERWSDFHIDGLLARQAAEEALVHCLKSLGMRSPAALAEQRVIDVGCGDGRWLRYLEGIGADPARLAGVDLREDRIAVARTRCLTANLSVGSAFSLPFPDDSFDLALMMLVMHNIGDEELRARAARELVRVVRPGGAVLYCDMFTGRHVPQFRRTTQRELAAWFAPLEVVARRGTYLSPKVRRFRRVLGAFAVRAQVGYSNYLYAIRISEAVKQGGRG